MADTTKETETDNKGAVTTAGSAQTQTSATQSDSRQTSATQPSKRTGTVTLEGLQKEMGDEMGRAEYLKYGVHFGVEANSLAFYHPPLDLDSIQTTEKE
jgi:hypothetical protein